LESSLTHYPPHCLLPASHQVSNLHLHWSCM
jgi:hypothetical protein